MLGNDSVTVVDQPIVSETIAETRQNRLVSFIAY